MRKQTACALQRKGIPRQLARGGVSFGSQLGFESPAFRYVNEHKLNSKKNELWKMKLSK